MSRPFSACCSLTGENVGQNYFMVSIEETVMSSIAYHHYKYLHFNLFVCPTEKNSERRQRRSLIAVVVPFSRTLDGCHDTPIRAGLGSGPACDTNSFL